VGWITPSFCRKIPHNQPGPLIRKGLWHNVEVMCRGFLGQSVNRHRW
jgi:hypothetical protein